ncbi:MAG: peptidoglycan editing factor PgeF [Candidatus Caldatribacteriota bacterium]|nr:peptidoglycan editing factor PgeF [Candidatus Caldatribacteriota bacterium]
MDNNFKLKTSGMIKYLQCQSKGFNQLTKHAFTTRCGGVSNKPYSNLNLSFNVNDKIENVIKNRKRIFNELNMDYKSVVSAKQVHKDNITVVNKGDKGRGALNYGKSISKSDALITNIPNLPLLMCYADCVPVLILDPTKKVIGLAHAGRNGTLLNISLKTLLKMKEIFGTRPDSCLAVIFPSIGPCCYYFSNREIIADWLTQENITNKVVHIKRKNNWQIDLKKANYIQLIKVGIKSQNIFTSTECTADNPDIYFSHHRDKGKTGRMAAIFMLKDNR